MKRQLKFFSAVIVAIVATACGNDDMPGSAVVENLTDKPILVRAGVDDLTTRAGMTGDALTTLGLTIVNPNSELHSYTNVEYHKSGDGSYFHTTEGVPTPLWQNASQQVTVTAYAPYTATWEGDQPFAVAVDQSTVEAARASDWLWVQDVVTPDAQHQEGNIFFRNHALNINLQHRLSKLVVNLRYNDEIDPAVSARSLTISSFATRCTVNAVDGTVGAADTPAAITAHHEPTAPQGYADTFEAIFPPQTVAFKLEILLSDGRDFLYYNPAFEFRSGVAYHLNLAVGKDKVVIAEGGITTEDWDHVAGGKLEVDEQE